MSVRNPSGFTTETHLVFSSLGKVAVLNFWNITNKNLQFRQARKFEAKKLFGICLNRHPDQVSSSSVCILFDTLLSRPYPQHAPHEPRLKASSPRMTLFNHTSGETKNQYRQQQQQHFADFCPHGKIGNFIYTWHESSLPPESHFPLSRHFPHISKVLYTCLVTKQLRFCIPVRRGRISTKMRTYFHVWKKKDAELWKKGDRTNVQCVGSNDKRVF